MRNLIVLLMLFSLNALQAQVQIVDVPKPGFEVRITAAVNKISIIDTHEHLVTEEQRLKINDQIDFTYLFKHYAKEDLISASNQKGLVELIYNTDLPILDRWELLQPFYKAMRSTGYGRVPLIAARELYGISEIDETTVEQLSLRMKKANKKGLYQHILKEKANIEFSIVDMGHQKFNKSFYRHVERFDSFILISSIEEIMKIGEQYHTKIQTISDFNDVLRKAFQDGMTYDMVAVKSALAYKRIIQYDNVSQEKAEKVFNSLLIKNFVNSSDIKALQDYFMHRLLDLADEFDLPIQIHTGLHAGNGNIITNSNPTHLANLFMEYPDVDFILFHAAYPYGGELGTLAKNFPNVYIDLCWSYVVSPSYSERYLHEWIETVPANKIMAFGGDYDFVEAIYAHAVMARQIIAKVLIAKVRDRYLTEKEAIDIAKMFLRENALNILKLNGQSNSLNDLEVLNRPGPIRDWWEIHKSNEGFIHSWKVMGSFDLGTGIDQVNPPEKEIDFNKSYKGKGGMVKWETENASSSGYLNLISIFSKRNADINPKSEGIAYAFTEVISPDNREVKITLGSNDGAKVWINDKVVYKMHGGRNAVADQEILVVKLKKGVNKILVKVENLGASWGLYLRIIDPENKLEIKKFD